MANLFIVFVTVFLAVLTFCLVGYLVILYSHPDEKDYSSSLFYKLVVVGMKFIR